MCHSLDNFRWWLGFISQEVNVEIQIYLHPQASTSSMQSSCQYSFEPVTEPAAVAAQGQKALCRSGPCVWPRASWTWSYLGFQDFSSSPTFQALDAAKAAPISRRRADPPSARLHEHGTRRHRPRQRTPHGAHNQGLATSGPRGASYRTAQRCPPRRGGRCPPSRRRVPTPAAVAHLSRGPCIRCGTGTEKRRLGAQCRTPRGAASGHKWN